MKLAIAGCGRISQVGYLAALRHVGGAELCALADPDRGRREVLAATSGGPPTFESVAALLEKTRPDALVIASPPGLHLEQAELAASAGVPVLVEKPPGRDAAEAERLAALDTPVWIGFNRRFSHLAAVAPRVPPNGELELSMRLLLPARLMARPRGPRRRAGRPRPSPRRPRRLPSRRRAALGSGHVDPARARPGRADRRARFRHGSNARRTRPGSSGSRSARARASSARAACRAGSREAPSPACAGASTRSSRRSLASCALSAPPSEARGPAALATAREGVIAMRALDAARASALSGGAVVRL